MQIKTLNINEIVPGMKAYGDIYNELGLLIFNDGFILKANAIAKLALYGIKTVKIQMFDTLEDEALNYKQTIDESPYTKQIKEKAKFKEFVQSYEKTQQKTIENMNDIYNGKEISKNKLIDMTDDVLKKVNTNKDLFDFINTIPVDDVTYTHSLNVSMLAKTFGKWINLSPDKIDDLGVAGLLHDLGKMQIPSAILDKPGKLTPEEYGEIKKHPIYSYRLAQTQNVSQYVLKAILMHHERYDGSGYPTGAKGDQIELLARVLAIADVYEAMTATRAYRSKICPFKVLDMLEVESYVQFDPRIIGKILENIANSYVGHSVMLNTGQIGTVLFINRSVSRPIVDVDGIVFDLSKEDSKKIYIEEVI